MMMMMMMMMNVLKKQGWNIAFLFSKGFFSKCIEVKHFFCIFQTQP